MTIEYGDTTRKAELGDKVKLSSQEQEVVKCIETSVLMLNIDADQLAPGDLSFIKKLGLTISNPDTDKPVALGVDYEPESFGHKVATFLSGAAIGAAVESEDNDDHDDDSSFFSSGGLFGGGSSFGGFGGGGFVGGGASGSF